MSPHSKSLAVRCFELFWRLYPPALRAQHPEASSLFLELERRERRRRGRVGAWLLLVRTVLDLLRHAPTAHRLESRFLRSMRSPVHRAGHRGLAMTTLRHDLVLAARLLTKQPLFTAIAALTLALGLGANTAIFSVVYGVLLRPLGVDDPDTLTYVTLHRESDRNDSTGFYPPHLEDVRERLAGDGAGAREILGTTAFLFEAATLMQDGAAIEIGSVLHTDGDFFRVVGYEPLLGRGLVPGDVEGPGTGNVAVIDETFWRDRFGGDPGVVGRTIILDERPVTIVGVLPAHVPIPERDHRLWMPRGFDGDPTLIGRVNLLARFDAGAGLVASEAALRRAIADVEPDHPRYDGYTVSLQTLREAMVGEVRPALLLSAGAVALILLIACANMANLLLARASARDREMATRRAIGARVPQLLHQLLVESLLLSLLGGALSIALALGLHRLLVALAPAGLPRVDAIRLDLPVLGFAAAITIVTGVLFGLAPVAHVLGLDLARRTSAAPRAGRRPGARLRSALVVVQVTVAVALLVTAVLMIRSLREASAVEPGFDGERIGGARVYLDSDAYPDDAEELAYFQQLLEGLAGRPDVEAAGATSGLPMDPQTIDYDLPYTLPGRVSEEEAAQAYVRTVSPGYFETMRIPLLEGRTFDSRDRPDTGRVAIVNRSFARLAWADASPVGESFSIYGGRRTLRVVGVVGDVRFSALTSPYKAEFYVPMAQMTYGAMNVVARGPDADLAARAIAEEALAVDPSQPVHSSFALTRLTADSIATNRFLAVLLTAFAAVALALAMAGIYGVLSQWVGESARELGVRVALGSSRSGIVGLVLRRSMLLGAVGIMLGLLGTQAIGTLIQRFLFGVRSSDPLSLIATAALIAITGLAASLRPALRAAQRPPMETLRAE
ncbi:MAG TPA: ADOP family duplicated permease [Thermoanaerobaculia bacterium]|nr:ADOP family duplicated permease [Thermoanaerobaculia bacterium]